jgi:multidrug efflux pump
MVIVGGLLVGTVFTLFVVPTLYSLLRRWKPLEVGQGEVGLV